MMRQYACHKADVKALSLMRECGSLNREWTKTRSKAGEIAGDKAGKKLEKKLEKKPDIGWRKSRKS